MALVTRFDTPASVIDTAVAAFFDDWSDFIESNLNTSPGTGTAVGEFVDPSEDEMIIAAERSLGCQ